MWNGAVSAVMIWIGVLVQVCVCDILNLHFCMIRGGGSRGRLAV